MKQSCGKGPQLRQSASELGCAAEYSTVCVQFFFVNIDFAEEYVHCCVPWAKAIVPGSEKNRDRPASINCVGGKPGDPFVVAEHRPPTEDCLVVSAEMVQHAEG